jgi:hypothetical protein
VKAPAGGTVLDPAAAVALHAFAQATVRAWARGEPLPPVPDHPALQRHTGAFVSLHRDGALRGCIGHLEDDLSLAEVTGRMAVAAARADPRFAPVDRRELEGLTVEISVLSPPELATPEEVMPGRDGVLVRRGGRQGLLLPQVAPEMGWGRLDLLEGVCRKAGLARGAWRDPATELLTFKAQVITGPAGA